MNTFGYSFGICITFDFKRENFEPEHEISNNVVTTSGTSKGSGQPAYNRSQIRAFASRLNIL